LKLELRTQDDLESLVYTLFYLVLGSLPWRRARRRGEPFIHTMSRIHIAKQAFTTALPVAGAPSEFSNILQLVDIPSHDLANAIAREQLAFHRISISMAIDDQAPILGSILD
jgi:hypothetical protein